MIGRIPHRDRLKVVVVDDGSTDGTFEIASSVSDAVVRHETNQGYGAAQITLYETALDMGVSSMVMIHSDGGHWPEDIPLCLAPIAEGTAQVVLGSRLLALGGSPAPSLKAMGAGFGTDMPYQRYLGQLALTWFQNLCYGTRFVSYHDGFRACTADALETSNFRSLDRWYRYDTEFLLAAHDARLRIEEVPVRPHYDPSAISGVPLARYVTEAVRHGLAHRKKQHARNQTEARVRSEPSAVADLKWILELPAEPRR